MAKPTGFMEFERKNNKGSEPSERIKNFNDYGYGFGLSAQQSYPRVE